MNFLIVTSGAGGHFYPGLALACELRQRKHTCIFCLKQKDAAIEELKNEGFAYVELPAIGLPRNLSIKLFKAILLFAKSLALSFIYIHRLGIACVVGFGGYVTAPIGLAAKITGKRVVIHEQNALPGLANKILAFFSHKIAISFPQTIKHFPQYKTIITGNPVRPAITRFIPPGECRKKLGLSTEKFTIFVFGGSQGARILNTLIPEALNYLEKRDSPRTGTVPFFHPFFQVIHLSGRADYEKVINHYAKTNVSAKVLPYLRNMEYGYGASDLVISRAGATTIWELVSVRKPAILIPYPHATGNHQLKNACHLAETGAAIVIEEQIVTAQKISELIKGFFANEKLLETMSKAYQKLSIEPAFSASKLADVVESVVG